MTNARGGHSNDNFGIAFDVGVFSGNRYLPEWPKDRAIGVLPPARAQDLSEREMLASLRQHLAAGTAVFA